MKRVPWRRCIGPLLEARRPIHGDLHFQFVALTPGLFYEVGVRTEATPNSGNEGTLTFAFALEVTATPNSEQLRPKSCAEFAAEAQAPISTNNVLAALRTGLIALREPKANLRLVETTLVGGDMSKELNEGGWRMGTGSPGAVKVPLGCDTSPDPNDPCGELPLEGPDQRMRVSRVITSAEQLNLSSNALPELQARMFYGAGVGQMSLNALQASSGEALCAWIQKLAKCVDLNTTVKRGAKKWLHIQPALFAKIPEETASMLELFSTSTNNDLQYPLPEYRYDIANWLNIDCAAHVTVEQSK